MTSFWQGYDVAAAESAAPRPRRPYTASAWKLKTPLGCWLVHFKNEKKEDAGVYLHLTNAQAAAVLKAGKIPRAATWDRPLRSNAERTLSIVFDAKKLGRKQRDLHRGIAEGAATLWTIAERAAEQ